MKTKYPNTISVGWLFAPALLILAGCSQTVWVDAGATEADSQVAMEQCLSTAYLQAPSAPTVATIGSDVASPSFTTCSGRGSTGSCITSRGRYTRPLVIRTDANARVRTQLFRQCMSAAGWSEQSRSSPTIVEAPDTDWTRGFDVGLTGGTAAQCTAPPSGTANGAEWSLGCQSGQSAR
jgi:hypothetical protein